MSRTKLKQTVAQTSSLKSVQGICFQVEHLSGTGQAIVERANQTLKNKLEVLAKAVGFTNAILPGDQARLLATAMLALNQFSRGDEAKSPTQKHWATQVLEEGPLVVIMSELGEWEQGWKIILMGRGYATLKN